MGLPTALPSAVAAASVFAEVFSVIAPPAVTVRPSAKNAFELVSAMFTEIAAATSTGPLDEEAEGFDAVLPAGRAPPAAAAALALFFSPATCESTVLGAPASPLPGAPLAPASEAVFVSEEPSAWKLTAPPAVMLRRAGGLDGVVAVGQGQRDADRGGGAGRVAARPSCAPWRSAWRWWRRRRSRRACCRCPARPSW